MGMGGSTKGVVKVNKILGSEKPADVLTKYVGGKAMNATLDELHMKLYSGRDASAPDTMSRGDTFGTAK